MGTEANLRQISSSASNRYMREPRHNDPANRSWPRQHLQAQRVQANPQRQQLRARQDKNEGPVQGAAPRVHQRLYRVRAEQAPGLQSLHDILQVCSRVWQASVSC